MEGEVGPSNNCRSSDRAVCLSCKSTSFCWTLPLGRYAKSLSDFLARKTALFSGGPELTVEELVQQITSNAPIQIIPSEVEKPSNTGHMLLGEYCKTLRIKRK